MTDTDLSESEHQTNENEDISSEPSAEDTERLPGDLLAAIEAILMVAERPVEPRLLAQLVEVSIDAIDTACRDLAAQYQQASRGFVLARVAGGYRFQSNVAQAAYVERFVLEGQVSKLSAAALETMAIVAYKQPISRAQVASIRGVSVDAVMRTLDQRGYIAEVARDGGPGQAVLYGTTPLFLERLGLDSVAELPELGDFVPEADIVEALEHGLRFTDVPDSPAGVDSTSRETSLDSGEESPPAELSADEEISIDLRSDSSAANLDAVTTSEAEE